jgi:hypothetical protein
VGVEFLKLTANNAEPAVRGASIKDCWIAGGNYGVYSDGAKGVTIDNTTFEGLLVEISHFDNGTGGATSENIVWGNNVNATAGLPAPGVTVTGVILGAPGAARMRLNYPTSPADLLSGAVATGNVSVLGAQTFALVGENSQVKVNVSGAGSFVNTGGTGNYCAFHVVVTDSVLGSIDKLVSFEYNVSTAIGCNPFSGGEFWLTGLAPGNHSLTAYVVLNAAANNQILLRPSTHSDTEYLRITVVEFQTL